MHYISVKLFAFILFSTPLHDITKPSKDLPCTVSVPPTISGLWSL